MKKILFGVLPVLAILVAGVVVYSFLFRPQPEAPTWVVSTYTGSVEVSLAAGPWVTAEMRQGLTDGDRLRTGPASGLTLVHGESHVEIKESTQIEVTQLNADQSKFELAQGQVFVEARGNQVGMRSQAGAAMDTKDAGVGMTVRPDGWTQVQVKRGEVNFTANDRTERVAEGEESHASVGGPPSAPTRIPDVLLLNVRFPDKSTFTSRVARIEGKADPGTRVQVADRVVDVGLDGTFATDITLDEGINQIAVAAIDSIGNTRTETSQPIRVDTMAPSLDGATIGRHAVNTARPGTGG